MNPLDILFQGQNFARLMQGLGVTLYIAAVSSALSVLFGIIFGFILRSKNRLIKALSRGYLEFFRIMPQLVLLFILYYELSSSISADTASIIVFTLWGSAEMGDLVRGAIQNVPKAYTEAGNALGLNRLQLGWFIILPATVRSLVPVSINLITRIIKTTSIVPLIGVVEVLKVGQQIVDFNRIAFPTASIGVYGLIFVLYFIACWPLSLLSGYLQKRIRT
ncbi:MAG: amino acid ABC transporter permease [Candidatus Ancillula sp.]|nr:amino acid ABC transporter permease [Candidatus Ancillula sp.]